MFLCFRFRLDRTTLYRGTVYYTAGSSIGLIVGVAAGVVIFVVIIVVVAAVVVVIVTRRPRPTGAASHCASSELVYVYCCILIDIIGACYERHLARSVN